MSTHYHTEDILESGLQDGCDRCAEHATHPVDSLDDKMLADYLERVRHNVRARSENEETAFREIRTAQRHAERIFLLKSKIAFAP